jgi:hypothetical protein
MRTGSLVHLFGRNNRKSTITGASPEGVDRMRAAGVRCEGSVAIQGSIALSISGRSNSNRS